MNADPNCPHCVLVMKAITTVGVVCEATWEHYAMALVRSMRMHGTPRATVDAFLDRCATAAQLAPPSPRRAWDDDPPEHASYFDRLPRNMRPGNA